MLKSDVSLLDLRGCLSGMLGVLQILLGFGRMQSAHNSGSGVFVRGVLPNEVLNFMVLDSRSGAQKLLIYSPRLL